MKKFVLGLSVVIAAVLLSFGLGLFPDSETRVNAAMAEFSVKNMTCSSCVGTINKALGTLEGIERVEILVTTGRSQVLYNPRQLDAQTIAQTISDSGFPATVSLEMTSDDYLALLAEESRLAKTYLARIGTQLITRADFEKKVEWALGSMQLNNQAEAVQQVRANLWNDLKERAILLSAAETNQVVVQQGEIDLRLEKLRNSTPDFDTAVLTSYESHEQFVQRLKEDMIIRRNIELNVVAGIENPQEQQQKLNQWFQGLNQQTPVVIFDQQLKQLAAGSRGGCGSGGGGCCSS